MVILSADWAGDSIPQSGMLRVCEEASSIVDKQENGYGKKLGWFQNQIAEKNAGVKTS